MREKLKIQTGKKKVMNWSITIDTREQTPWLFQDLKTMTCDFVVSASQQGLKQGDYAVAGFEDRLVIERKSLEDLYGTLATGRDRFRRELERISDCCRMGAVVVEADWNAISDPEAYRNNWRSRMNPQSIVGSIQSYAIRFSKVHWFCMPSRREAEWTAFQLMRFSQEEFQRRFDELFEGTTDG